jgi:hypothetical protein
VLTTESDPTVASPVFYLEPFDDGGSGKSRMCAVDWDGKLRREIGRGLALRQSPDGRRLLAVDYPIVNDAPATYVVIDDQDKVLAKTSSIWRDEAIWADDSRHLCYIADDNSSGMGGIASLELVMPGDQPRRVSGPGFITYIPMQSNGGPASTPFVSGPHLLACSVAADRAVVLDPETGTVTVFRLSDGASLMRHSFGHHFYPYTNPRGNETLVASIDGRYLADNVDGQSSVPIIDLLSDRTAITIHALLVSGFTWDGSRLVARLDERVIAVIDWQTGRVAKRLTGTYSSSMPRPGSEDVLVGVPSSRHQFGLDLYIVRADGSAFEVARSVEVVS